jgi:hypothetical protein
MGFQDFISENEAMSLTGMSKTTLVRFAEAGYLQLETDSDGLRLFSKGELASLFGFRDVPHRGKALTERKIEKPQEQSVAKPVLVEISAEAAKLETENLTLAEQVEKIVIATTEGAQPQVAVDIEAPIPPVSEFHGVSKDALEAELRRLRNIMELQERILDMKDQQLRDLKEQRDWLQQRVEKLEDKADRDQILLLTETQTIRNLIKMNQSQRRSPVRLALEWLGVAAPRDDASESGTIEVQSRPEADSRK